MNAVCSVGCIGCGICEKQCPKQAITVVDNVAHIDYEKCTSCGICAAKCPKKCITIVPGYTAPDAQKVSETFQIPEKPKEQA